MKYTTKEDPLPRLHNVDKELLHDNYQMKEIARITKGKLVKNSYFDRKFQTKFKRDRLLEICANYRKETALESISKAAKGHIHPEIMKQMSETTKKGVYIHGEPGTGKSSTVYAYTGGNQFNIPIQSKGRFMFSDYDYEDYIVCEDYTEDELVSLRTTINQLTDDHGVAFGESKGGGLKPVYCEKLIITSNEYPTEWNGFRRRFTEIREVDRETSVSEYVPPAVEYVVISSRDEEYI